MPVTPFRYSVEQEQYLREMCTTPASYREIADAFNARFGTDVSRSAILGKCDRMGTRDTKRSSKGAARSGNKVRRDRLAVAAPAPRAPRSEADDLIRDENDRGAMVSRSKAVDVSTVFDASSPTAKSFLDLRRGECRWPASSDASMACGARSTIGSYCTTHASIAYRTMPTRKRNDSVMAGAGLLDTRERAEVVRSPNLVPPLAHDVHGIEALDGEENHDDD